MCVVLCVPTHVLACCFPVYFFDLQEKLVLQSVTPQCRLHYVALVTEDSSVDYDLCRTFFRDVSYVFKVS